MRRIEVEFAEETYVEIIRDNRTISYIPTETNLRRLSQIISNYPVIVDLTGKYYHIRVDL